MIAVSCIMRHYMFAFSRKITICHAPLQHLFYFRCADGLTCLFLVFYCGVKSVVVNCCCFRLKTFADDTITCRSSWSFSRYLQKMESSSALLKRSPDFLSLIQKMFDVIFEKPEEYCAKDGWLYLVAHRKRPQLL